LHLSFKDKYHEMIGANASGPITQDLDLLKEFILEVIDERNEKWNSELETLSKEAQEVIDNCSGKPKVTCECVDKESIKGKTLIFVHVAVGNLPDDGIREYLEKAREAFQCLQKYKDTFIFYIPTRVGDSRIETIRL